MALLGGESGISGRRRERGGQRQCLWEKEKEGRVARLMGGEGGGCSGEWEEKPSCGREGKRGEGGSGEKEEEKDMKMRKGEGGCEENEFGIRNHRVILRLHDGLRKLSLKVEIR
ncbi:hypothetical protein TIFTF001_021068 [Ficus carica]|uniref:Uncharacterized protein n=1 Tax=Ficus carica TaxID=3494 RepID=A0AA88DDA1_FICCA|nr:hypothetical protein TIFTF001_021068 [Ficus carica]